MTRNPQLRGLGARTQEAYLRAVRRLATFYRPAPNQFNEEQLCENFLRLKNHSMRKIRSLSVPSCLDFYHKLVEAARRILTIDHQVYFGIETISKTIGFGCDKLDS
jgi:hypothetical protein